MKATIDSLKETATELKERIPDLKDSCSRLAGHVRQHPIPYAIAGTGLACALGYALTATSRRRTVEGAIESTQARIADTARTTQNKISGAAEKVSESAKAAFEGTKDKVDGVTETVTKTVENAKDKTLSLVDEKPFLVGAGVVAAGFIAGLLLPSSRKENEWFGEKKDQLISDAKAAGRKILDDGKQILQEGKDLVAEGTERAKNAVEAADHAVRDAVKDTGSTIREKVDKAERAVIKKAEKVNNAAKA